MGARVGPAGVSGAFVCAGAAGSVLGTEHARTADSATCGADCTKGKPTIWLYQITTCSLSSFCFFFSFYNTSFFFFSLLMFFILRVFTFLSV